MKVGNEPAGKAPCLSPGGAADLVQRAFKTLEGRWKLIIVFHLFSAENLRFSAIDRALEGISQKVLTQQLRELERDGIVSRTVYSEVPPRVEYRLTAAGAALRPALQELRRWSEQQQPAAAAPAHDEHR